jgi:hypothetical protein
MRILSRIEKLENMAISMNKGKLNPYDQARQDEIEDWVTNDPKAKEILESIFKHSKEKEYPSDIDCPEFFDDLDDPVFWSMVQESLQSLDKYLRGKAII